MAENAVKQDLRSKFLKKKATMKKIMVAINGEQSEITVAALPEKVVRDLRAKHPPISKDDKNANIPYNSATVPPDLLAHSVVDPALTYEEWLDIWGSEEWSLGELRELYDKTFSVTTAGFDIPFGGSGSERIGS